MSYIGYFKATVENFHKLNKFTPKIKAELKEAIRQFEYSKWVGDFEKENKDELKYLEQEFKKIYDVAYN